MYEWLPSGIELLTETSAADWVVSGLRPRDHDSVRVGSFIPDAFDAFARVLHPAGDRGGESRGLRWSEVASRLSGPFHAEMQFQELAGDDAHRHPILGDIQPDAGSLPQSLLRSLVRFPSYVGGSEDLIAELHRSEEIEAVPSRLDAPLDWGI